MSSANSRAPGRRRNNPTINVIARSVRAALALTATALALSGSGVAFAAVGTCTPPGAPPPSSSVSCDGVFNTANANVPIAYAVEDLTVVLGAIDPTTSVTTNGLNGVDLAGTIGNETLINHASISTSYAYAIHISTTSGDISLISDGAVLAYSPGVANITAVSAISYSGDIGIDNLLGGTVTADAYNGSATGINAQSSTGNITVTSAGAITATSANGATYGIYATSNDGAVTVTNNGDITASGVGNSYGIYGQSYANLSLTNNGTIAATSTGNYSTAYGIFAYTCDCNALDVVIDNSNSITATATGARGTAFGVYVYAYGYGNATVTNGGDITATASGAYGIATGIYVTLTDGTIDIDSSNSITATGSRDAYGIHAYANGDGNATITTSGTIDVTSVNDAAFGISVSTGGIGDIYVNNGAAMTVDGAYGAVGVLANAYGDGAVTIGNSGSMGVTAYYGNAYGIHALAYGTGDVTASTAASGTINASSAFGDAFGIKAYAAYGNVIVDNDGSITTDGVYFSVGIQTLAYGDTAITGSGDISATSTGGSSKAYGIYALSNYNGNITINLTGGTIDVYTDGASSGAHGIFASAQYGDVSVNSAANINVESVADSSTGIDALSSNGDVIVDNSGDITSTAGVYALGISAFSGSGSIVVSNSGSIVATTNTDTAWGVAAFSGVATSVDNSGTIVATADSYGIGMQAFGVSATYVANSSAVSATAYSGYAYGIIAIALGTGGVVDVVNSGQINANGHDATYGVIARAYATGYVNVTNASGGSIDATSDAGLAYGIDATAYNVALSNDGSISATSYNTFGYAGAFGIRTYAYGDATIANGGNVSATALGLYGADAYGILVEAGFGDIVLDHDGSAFASATADEIYGSAYAVGIAVNGYSVNVTTGASSSIRANASGYYATAIGLAVNGSYGLSLETHGSIEALATGTYGEAVGLQATSYVALVAYNFGDINAEFVGAYGSATGVRLSALTGDIFFYNGGDITATDANYAVGVELDGSGSTTLFNQGTITADSSAAGSIAVLTGGSDDTIRNYGTINGALLTGAGDDTLYNATGGIWNAVGTTDFGAGDDGIDNHGTINMNDASILMGSYVAGNTFVNFGTINVSGANNVIDMDNPFPVFNYGTIDFQDGAPDDVLTIVGDFAGDGDINVDVSALNATSDMLYIDGNVISSSVNTINVDLLDLPSDGSAEVPVVTVSGDSVAGNFVLGNVNYSPNPFVTVGFSLVSNISTANTTDDIFSFRVAMTGLSDTGAIAALLPAGVDLLMRDVVGNWHQRDVGDPGGGKLSLWARVYRNKGSVEPDHHGDNIGDGGNFDFELRNTGGEAGFDYAFNDRFNVGLILGHANADQSLRVGLGTDRIGGTVAGGYGTMRLPGGFYLDLSHRRLKFGATLDSALGEFTASGEAQTSNAESGYKFSYKGLEIEGQVQLTHTRLVSLDPIQGPATFASARLMSLAATDAGTIPLDNDADISSTSRVGVDFRKKFQRNQVGALWEVHATLNRVTEFHGRNAYQINGTLNGETDIGGSSSLLDVGFTRRSGLLLIYGGLTWQDGGVLKNFFGAQLAAKYTW